MNHAEKSLEMHKKWSGKLEISCRVPLDTTEDLSLAYTPGVAAACLEIKKDPKKSYELTRRSNLIAVITDGTAVLGLGNIGPLAAMPVMEGKCVLFKKFGDVDAIPLCINPADTDEAVNTIKLLQGSFGGINLEDISAPRCFEIEERLKQCCDIPIFHDDQHGTAIVTLAAVLNAIRFTKKNISTVKTVVNGAGAAGTAIVKLLLSSGMKNITVCDREGAIYKSRRNLSGPKAELALITDNDSRKGSLSDVMKNADIFIGVSTSGCVTENMVRSMAADPIVFAMANPDPEIFPHEAKKAGAAVVGTGRSDFPNQINNVLVFPGIFRGALDARASEINDEMKKAAANAIVNFITDDELNADYIIPSSLNKELASAVAKATFDAAISSGVSGV